MLIQTVFNFLPKKYVDSNSWCKSMLIQTVFNFLPKTTETGEEIKTRKSKKIKALFFFNLKQL